MTRPRTGFEPDGLLQCLARLPVAREYIVGYSGGADSTALLLALAELGERRPAPIQALHFDHGLHRRSGDWQAHCARFCAARGIGLRTVHLEVPRERGSSPELAARQARYLALEGMLQAGEMYLTAHHADDRAETLFLNLMRGSGIEGLASIPELRRLGAGWVGRPLLGFARRDLLHYLQVRGVEWIDDPSNRDTTMDRNYLRHELFPALDRRWPGTTTRLARTAQHAREVADVLSADLNRRFGHIILDRFTLDAASLLQLPRTLQALLVRLWVRDSDLPSPPGSRLAAFLDQLEAAATSGGTMELRWAGWQIRRHRDRLWLHRQALPAPCPELDWDGGGVLDLGPVHGSLRIAGGGSAPEGLRVGPRRSGDRMRLHCGGPGRRVKDLLRESGVPPWLRDSIPVLYHADEVLALGDWMLSGRWRAWLAEHGATFQWTPEDDLLRKLRAGAKASAIDRPAPVR